MYLYIQQQQITSNNVDGEVVPSVKLYIDGFLTK